LLSGLGGVDAVVPAPALERPVSDLPRRSVARRSRSRRLAEVAACGALLGGGITAGLAIEPGQARQAAAAPDLTGFRHSAADPRRGHRNRRVHG